jgi:hypothetical protein
MNILKYAVLGAIVALGVNYITAKREDGTSILDELTDRSPELMDRMKNYATQAVDHLSDNLKTRLS